MGWTGRGVYSTIGEEIGKFTGEELDGVVAVQGPDDASGASGDFIGQGCKGGDELAHVRRGFGFVPHEIYGLETRMVVNQYQRVLVTSMRGAYEGTNDVGMNQAARA
eukprot:1171445-Pleurochrysis_carterae.AAC.1